MVPSTNMFVEALEKWASALRQNDFTTARTHAQSIVRSGELLTLRPEFSRCFSQHYPNLEAGEALHCLCQFLVCATEGRAQMLKQ